MKKEWERKPHNIVHQFGSIMTYSKERAALRSTNQKSNFTQGFQKEL